MWPDTRVMGYGRRVYFIFSFLLRMEDSQHCTSLLEASASCCSSCDVFRHGCKIEEGVSGVLEPDYYGQQTDTKSGSCRFFISIFLTFNYDVIYILPLPWKSIVTQPTPTEPTWPRRLNREALFWHGQFYRLPSTYRLITHNESTGWECTSAQRSHIYAQHVPGVTVSVSSLFLAVEPLLLFPLLSWSLISGSPSHPSPIPLLFLCLFMSRLPTLSFPMSIFCPLFLFFDLSQLSRLVSAYPSLCF